MQIDGRRFTWDNADRLGDDDLFLVVPGKDASEILAQILKKLTIGLPLDDAADAQTTTLPDAPRLADLHKQSDPPVVQQPGPAVRSVFSLLPPLKQLEEVLHPQKAFVHGPKI